MIEFVPSFPAELQRSPEDPVEILRNQLAAVAGDDGHEMLFLMHAKSQRAVLFKVPECVLHFVPVSVPVHGRHHPLIHGMIHFVLIHEPAEDPVLLFQLLLIGNSLIDTASAILTDGAYRHGCRHVFFHIPKTLRICHKIPSCTQGTCLLQ